MENNNLKKEACSLIHHAIKSAQKKSWAIKSKKGIDQKDLALITSGVMELKKRRSVKAAILFGSFARNEQKPLSDIDMCAVTGKGISLSQKARIVSCGSKKVQISIFWDLPASVRYAALREGKILYNKNKDFFHDSLVQTMSEYLDFKHILQRNINEALEI